MWRCLVKRSFIILNIIQRHNFFQSFASIGRVDLVFNLFSILRPKSTIFDSQKKPKRQENIESVISLRKQGVWEHPDIYSYLRAAEYDMAATGVDRIKRMMTNWGFTGEEEVVFLSGNVDEIVSRYSSHLFAFNDLHI